MLIRVAEVEGEFRRVGVCQTSPLYYRNNDKKMGVVWESARQHMKDLKRGASYLEKERYVSKRILLDVDAVHEINLYTFTMV